MKRLVFLIIVSVCLLASCNLSLLTADVPGFEEDYSGQTEKEFDTNPVGGVMASSAYYEDRIIVRWNEVEGADYYSLERAEFDTAPDQEAASSATWQRLYNSVDRNRFEDRDSTLQGGKYYAYRVTAHSYEGEVSSSPSAIGYGSLLAPPSSLDATKGTDLSTITVSWPQMPGIERYYIYSSTASDTVSIGEMVGTVAQLDSQEPNGQTNSFTYTVPQAQLGTNLYFAVSASGGNRIESASLSPVTSGYTRVQGAASTPSVHSVTQGDSVEGITLMWEADPASTDDDPITYTVTRSSAGSSEITIFPTYAGQVLDYDSASGCYYIVDTNSIQENVEYRYSIVASNSIGMSQAAVATGYILSPPQSLSFSAQDSGYALSAVLPVGADPEWMYEASVVYESGRRETMLLSEGELLGFVEEITAQTASDDVAYQNEIRTFTVSTVNGDVRSRGSATASIQGIPDTPVLDASENARSLMAANDNGVFPVVITLTGSGYTPYDYVITRRGVGSDSSDVITFTSAESVCYDNDGTVAGHVYSYSAVARDQLGRSSAESASVEGYGAITGLRYTEIFEDFILKPWENGSLNPEYVSGNKSSIWNYIRQSGLGSLGSASVTGFPLLGVPDSSIEGRTGTLGYRAEAQGVGGNVGFTYTTYMSEAGKYFDRDFYLAQNASYNMIVSLSGSGSVSGGPFRLDGMYPGLVDFGGLSVSSNAFIGTYRVTQYHEGGVEVTYEVVL